MQKNLLSRLKNGPCALVVFNGHGESGAVFGHQDQILLDENNAGALEGKIAYIRSCAALERLGHRSVEKGARAIIGYSGEFIFPTQHEHQSTPLGDPLAGPVLRTSNLIPKKLVEGASVKDAVHACRQTARKQVEALLRHPKDPYNEPVIRSLILNDLSLGIEGSPEAQA